MSCQKEIFIEILEIYFFGIYLGLWNFLGGEGIIEIGIFNNYTITFLHSYLLQLLYIHYTVYYIECCAKRKFKFKTWKYTFLEIFVEIAHKKKINNSNS